MCILLNPYLSYESSSNSPFRAIIGPYLVSRNVAFGQSVTEDPFWAGLTSYTSMDGRFASPDHPSPRYWLLWPGVACMLAVAFTGTLPFSMGHGRLKLSRIILIKWSLGDRTGLPGKGLLCFRSILL